jgi:hypothetical protein
MIVLDRRNSFSVFFTLFNISTIQHLPSFNMSEGKVSPEPFFATSNSLDNTFVPLGSAVHICSCCTLGAIKMKRPAISYVPLRNFL